MKLVIEIPDEVYSHAKDFENRLLTPYEEIVIQDCVANGTPLPKGHGRIIDESEITSIYYHEEKAEQGAINFRGMVIDGTDAPTIIERDDNENL